MGIREKVCVTIIGTREKVSQCKHKLIPAETETETLTSLNMHTPV